MTHFHTRRISCVKCWSKVCQRKLKILTLKCQVWKDILDLRQVKNYSFGYGKCRTAQFHRSGKIWECAIGLISLTSGGAPRRQRAPSLQEWNAGSQVQGKSEFFAGIAWKDSPNETRLTARGWSLNTLWSPNANAPVSNETDGSQE